MRQTFLMTTKAAILPNAIGRKRWICFRKVPAIQETSHVHSLTLKFPWNTSLNQSTTRWGPAACSAACFGSSDASSLPPTSFYTEEGTSYLSSMYYSNSGDKKRYRRRNGGYFKDPTAVPCGRGESKPNPKWLLHSWMHAWHHVAHKGISRPRASPSSHRGWPGHCHGFGLS